MDHEGKPMSSINWAARRLAEIAKDADFSIRHDLWDIRKALLEDETRAYRPKCAYTYCTHMSAVDNEFCEESTCPKLL